MNVNKLSIIIPCFNEEKYIESTLMRVLRANIGKIKKEIIVVDDGSEDNSTRIIEKVIKQNSDIDLICHKINRGKGASIKTGLGKARGDIVIIQDADGEYDPNDYSILIAPFKIKNTHVVYGSRTLGIAKYGNRYSTLPFYLGGRLLTIFMNKLYKTQITDQPTGFKLFSKSVIPVLMKNMKEKGFSAEVEMTASVAQAGLTIVEVPVRYVPRSIKEGKKIRFYDFIRSLYVAVRYKSQYHGYKRI